MGLFNTINNTNKKLKSAQSELDKTSLKLNDLSNGIKNVTDTCDNVSNTFKKVKSYASFWNSDEYNQKSAEIKKYNQKSDRVFKVFIFIYIVMIITTIVLCIANNDIILRLVGLR